jgi:hypothetical protein
MSILTSQTIDLVKMLPEEELVTVNALLKLLVRTWDEDFTKVTPSEKTKLDKIDKEMEEGVYFSEEEVFSEK